MAVTLITKPTPDTVDAFVVDAFVTETHSYTNVITDHPVEEGANVSDHSRPEPDRLMLEVLVSGSPLSGDGDTRPTISSTDPRLTFRLTTEGAHLDGGRMKTAYEKFMDLRETGALVTVVTSFRRYDSMAIESISIPRDAKGAGALRFTVALKKIRIVRNKLTRAVVAKDKRVGSKVKLGPKTTKKAEEPDVDPLRKVVNAGKSAVQKVGSFF